LPVTASLHVLTHIEVAGELVDDGFRRARRREHPEPGDMLRGGQPRFGDRRHVRQRGYAFRGGDRDRAHGPSFTIGTAAGAANTKKCVHF